MDSDLNVTPEISGIRLIFHPTEDDAEVGLFIQFTRALAVLGVKVVLVELVTIAGNDFVIIEASNRSEVFHMVKDPWFEGRVIITGVGPVWKAEDSE